MFETIIFFIILMIPYAVLLYRQNQLQTALASIFRNEHCKIQYRIEKVIQKVTSFKASERTLDEAVAAVLKAAQATPRPVDITDEEWLTPIIEQVLLGDEEEEEPKEPELPGIEMRLEGGTKCRGKINED